jgi:hypothetical protein
LDLTIESAPTGRPSRPVMHNWQLHRRATGSSRWAGPNNHFTTDGAVASGKYHTLYVSTTADHSRRWHQQATTIARGVDAINHAATYGTIASGEYLIHYSLTTAAHSQ